MSKKTSKEPQVTGFSYDEFFNNRLSLNEEQKAYLKGQGVDWRFINAANFSANGNVHRSHWKPLTLTGEAAIKFGANAGGQVQRGDLILAVRPKEVSAKHREFLDRRNAIQKGSIKQAAKQLKQSARDYGVGDQTKVYEGYEENE